MAFDQLSDFLQKLAHTGELVRIPQEVDPRHQIAAITSEARRSDAQGGPAVLFESVKGSRVPVVTNLLGTPGRVLLALGDESFESAGQRLDEWLTPRVPDATADSKFAPVFARLAKLVPRSQKTAFSQQVARLGRDINLHELPFPRSFPGETGPTVTCAQLWLTSPETGLKWISAPVLEVGGPQSLLVHWPLTDRGPDIVDEYRQQNQPTPVMISIGGDPLLHLAAQLPGIPDTDACQLASVLRGQTLNVVRGRTLELEGPADADFLIEGYIDPQEIDAAQGTVASPSGLLVTRQRLAVIRVTAVTHRSQPVLPYVVHVAGNSEETAWAPLLSQLLLPVMRRIHPGVQTFQFSRDGQGRRIAFVGLRTRFPGHARRILQGLAQWPALADVMLLIGVDEDVAIHDSSTVWQHVAQMSDPVSDFLTVTTVRDSSHRACHDLSRAGTLLIDATRKPDPRTGEWIELADLTPESREAAAIFWRGVRGDR